MQCRNHSPHIPDALSVHVTLTGRMLFVANTWLVGVTAFKSRLRTKCLFSGRSADKYKKSENQGVTNLSLAQASSYSLKTFLQTLDTSLFSLSVIQSNENRPRKWGL